MLNLLSLPPNHSEWSQGIDELFWLTYYLTGIAFLAVCAILVGCCILYRERPGHRAEYFHGDSKIHLATTGLLSALVFLGLDYQLESRGRRVVESYKLGFEEANRSLRIQVRGQQFKWYFRYAGPDGKFGTKDDFVTMELVVPVNTKVAVQIQSKDVIHSFYLPYQRIKQDAVPGITTTAWFESNTEGDWEVGCAELCGSGHTNMRNPMAVKSADEYQAWLAQNYADDADEDFTLGEEEVDGEYVNWGWTWAPTKTWQSSGEIQVADVPGTDGHEEGH